MSSSNNINANTNHIKVFSDLSKQLSHLRKLREKINNINDNENDDDKNYDNDNDKTKIKNNAIDLKCKLNISNNNSSNSNQNSQLDDSNETITKSPTRKNRENKFRINKNNDDKSHLLIDTNGNNNQVILQATVKLLLQSIEEQGRLRALLEYTNDPNVIIKQLESQLINTINSNTKITVNNTNDIINDNIKLRGTLLELERTVIQMIKIKQEYDSEYNTRIETEKALEVMHEQMKKKDNEIEVLKSQYRRLQTMFDQQQLQLEDLTINSIRNNETSKNIYDSDPSPPTSPLPPPDDDEEENYIQDQNLLEQSTQKSLLLDIDIGGGKTDRVMITATSDPLILAFNFLREHALAPNYLEPLSSYISSMKETLLGKHHNDDNNDNEIKVSPSTNKTGSPTLKADTSPQTPKNDLNYSSSSPGPNPSPSPISISSISISRDLSISKELRNSSPIQPISSPSNNEIQNIEQVSPVFSPPPPPPPSFNNNDVITVAKSKEKSVNSRIESDTNNKENPNLSTFYISNVSSDALTFNESNDSKLTINQNDSKDGILVYSQSENDIKSISDTNDTVSNSKNDQISIDVDNSTLYETISDDSNVNSNTNITQISEKVNGMKTFRKEILKSPNDELFEKAVTTFDTATDLVNDGKIEAAIPLYHNALYLFELTGLAEIDAIREEVKYWTNYAANEKKKEKINSTNVNSINLTTKDSNNISIIQPVPVISNNKSNLSIIQPAPVTSNNKSNQLDNPSVVSNSKKSSRVLESNGRLQSMADMKRSNPNAFQYIGNNKSNINNKSRSNDISLPPQIIYNNFMGDFHKEASNINDRGTKSKRSSI